MKLKNRRAKLTLGTLQILSGAPDQLSISFEIEKGHVPGSNSPNTARFQVRNLTRDHVKQLIAAGTPKKSGARATGVRTRFEAGYEEGTSRIFEGDLRHIFLDRTPPDGILHVESGDGDVAIATARINRSWSPGTAVDVVIRDVAQELGVGLGNLEAKLAGATLLGGGNVFVGGTVASGSAIKELNRLTKSIGLSWSLQDGVLQLLGTSEALGATAVVISKTTGMVGSPSIDQKGIVSVKMLLIPDVFPGRKLKIESEDLQGFFRVDRAKYSGDTAGGDWYIECDCRRL